MIARRKFTQFFLSTLAAGTVSAISRASSSVNTALSPTESNLEMLTTTDKKVTIQDINLKVMGVDGCGANAALHMMASGVPDLDYIFANTDYEALDVAAGTELFDSPE